MPGENITFFSYSLLYWQKCDQFILRIEAGDGGYYIFKGIWMGIVSTPQVEFRLEDV
ncbi:hypothetical protein [Nostoc sp.]|uniref:hypothetical protein n=1 Tax=Nostoc sp. TaxID=1180 RepID=UPI002FF98B8C